MPGLIKHKRSREAESWLKKEIAEQKARFRKIEHEMNVVIAQQARQVDRGVPAQHPDARLPRALQHDAQDQARGDPEEAEAQVQGRVLTGRRHGFPSGELFSWPRPHIEPFVDREVPFKKMTLPGFPKGMHYKMLSLDTDTGACSMTVQFEPGYELPPGMSYSEMELFVMQGYIEMGDKTARPGHLHLPAAPAWRMPAMKMPRGITGAAVLQLRRAELRRVGRRPPRGRAREARQGECLRRPAVDLDELLPGDGARLHGQDPASSTSARRRSPSCTA